MTHDPLTAHNHQNAVESMVRNRGRDDDIEEEKTTTNEPARPRPRPRRGGPVPPAAAAGGHRATAANDDDAVVAIVHCFRSRWTIGCSARCCRRRLLLLLLCTPPADVPPTVGGRGGLPSLWAVLSLFRHRRLPRTATEDCPLSSASLPPLLFVLSTPLPRSSQQRFQRLTPALLRLHPRPAVLPPYYWS